MEIPEKQADPCPQKQDEKGTFTDAQWDAITVRNKTLLVSAAAGSGKTRVLTERAIRILLDKTHPTDLSRLLIVTFTKAAAEELKSRIASALSQALAKDPDNEHLSHQMFLLGSAQISTIDSFFSKTVRDHFTQLEIPASFRACDSKELLPLSLEIIDRQIADFYEKYKEKSGNSESKDDMERDLFTDLHRNRFARSMNHLMGNRHDPNLNESLFQFHDSLLRYPEGIGVLKQCADEYRKTTAKNLFDSSLGKAMIDILPDFFVGYEQIFKEIQNTLQAEPEQDLKLLTVVASDIDFCQKMQGYLLQKSYLETQSFITTEPLARFGTSGKSSVSDSYKKIRGTFRERLKSFKDNFFDSTLGSPEIDRQLQETADLAEMLYELFSAYEEALLTEKKKRGVLSFDDIRSLLYQLLYAENKTQTPYAEALANRYDAVYIDEYQDVDEIQDSIFLAIGGNRRFMVGDIKQSIYGFRGSDPSAFASYRAGMPAYNAESAKNSDECSIFMSSNFRCDKPVIDFANQVCGFLFSASPNSIHYQKEDDLQYAKKQDENGVVSPHPVQVLVFGNKPGKSGSNRQESEEAEDRDSSESNTPSQEAVWVANEIKRLLTEKECKNDSRPIQPKDIVILVRKRSSGKDFVRALNELQIPVASAEKVNLFESPKTVDLMNLLQVLDNPYRDIPLTEFLMSKIGGFTLTQIGEIRSAKPESSKKSLYDALCAVSENDSHPLQTTVKETLDWLERYRSQSLSKSADRLLKLLLLDPRLTSYAGSTEAMFLYEQARIYQKQAFCGLFGFLDHLQKAILTDSASGEGFQKQENAVTVMTVHKSKGLEFPVVFLCAAGSKLNSNRRPELLFRKNTGLGSKLFVPEFGENRESFIRKIVKKSIVTVESEESVRLLYVALTRARERLYVTGTADSPFDEIPLKTSVIRRDNRYCILAASSFLMWILAALDEPQAKAPDFPCDVHYIPYEESQKTPDADEAGPETDVPTDPEEPTIPLSETEEFYQSVLKRQSEIPYDLSSLKGIPAKAAASKLSPTLLDDILAQSDTDRTAIQQQLELMRSAVPHAFDDLLTEDEKPSAADIGTAAHLFLQVCNFENLFQNGVRSELERLKGNQQITESAAKLIPISDIEAFCESDLASLISGSVNYRREQQFSLLLPLCELTESAERKHSLQGQNLFVQGSIDLLIEKKNGGLVLVDYKTDSIPQKIAESERSLTDFLLSKHGNQLAVYGQAVKNLCGKYPDEVLIYSLPLGRTVSMPVNFSLFSPDPKQ